jgi:hypothetical protein
MRRRSRLRTLMIVVTLLSLLCAYVGSYCWLSRRRMKEGHIQDMDCFLYVSVDEVAATHDLTSHYRLTTFYAPLNWLDREFFGGQQPVGSIMWGLSP